MLVSDETCLPRHKTSGEAPQAGAVPRCQQHWITSTSSSPQDESQTGLRSGRRRLGRARRRRAFFLVHLAAARATVRRPSATLLSSKATACCIAKLTRLLEDWPMPRWTASATAHGTADHGAVLIIDDLGMRKLPLTPPRKLLEIIMRRMNAPARCSHRIDRWKTGQTAGRQRRRLRHARSSALTDTCSSAARASWRTKTGSAGVGK